MNLNEWFYENKSLQPFFSEIFSSFSKTMKQMLGKLRGALLYMYVSSREVMFQNLPSVLHPDMSIY